MGTDPIVPSMVYLPDLKTPIELRELKKRVKTVPERVPRNKLIESLQLADRMQEMLDNGEAQNKADIARQLGLTRARVTQVMKLLELPDSFKKTVQDAGSHAAISERLIRSILTEKDSNTKGKKLLDLVRTHLVPTFEE